MRIFGRHTFQQQTTDYRCLGDIPRMLEDTPFEDTRMADWQSMAAEGKHLPQAAFCSGHHFSAALIGFFMSHDH